MAEGVQFQLERQLGELEQMVHCGLFTKQETSAIIKKRKQCEYKVHRHSKSKEDYLHYVRYESALLALLRKRRERDGYGFRKKEIDHAILNRIHSLFRAALKRFQGDVSLWLTYVEFCKEKRNNAMVSRTFSDLLAIHSHDPSLWIMAAQWEMEENKDAETARSLLQRGLRFLGESTILWKEYLRMELIHVETMRKRMRMLTSTGVEEEEEEAASSLVEDPILSGKIVGVVYRSAVANLPDNVDLLFEFLPVATSFAETLPDLETWIYEDLKMKFSTDPRSWDALARRHLTAPEKKKKATSVLGGDDDVDVERRRIADVEKRENAAASTFEEGLSATNGDAKLWKFAVTFAVEMLEKGETEPTLTKPRLRNAIDWLTRADLKGCVDEDLRLDWIRILRNFSDDDDDRDGLDASTVLNEGLEKIPASQRLWSIKLQMEINEATYVGESDRVRRTLETAVAKVDEKDAWTLWETFLDWLTATSDDPVAVETAFKKACSRTGRESSKSAKEAFVKYASMLGEDKLMEAYAWLKLHRPHSKTYFSFVVSALTEEETTTSKKRSVYLDAIDELGKSDVDLWLEYERFESRAGNTGVGSVYKKALRELDTDLLPEYETKHTLTITGHLKD